MQDIPGSEILWNLWAGIVFFVKIVEMLGCLGELMYICNSLDSIWLWQENYIL
jgi:hypothetical protein